MGDVTAFTGGQVPAALAGTVESNDDLSAGIRGGYGVVSVKGGRWHIKKDGETTTVTDATSGDPVGSLKLVMLKASPHVSKNYYPGGWSEGSTEHPTCTSMDGITPDPGSEEVQAPSCAVCPMNVYGSKVTDDGKKIKACSDSRRIAVVPEGDYKNEVYGGPMLLRVPAGSLSNLATYGKKIKQIGFPYNTVITRTSFDLQVSHPKIEFNAVRPLTDDEANEIVALLGDFEYADKIEAVLAKDLEIVPLEDRPTEDTPASLFEQPPAAPTPAPVAAKPEAAAVALTVPATPTAVKPAPAPTLPAKEAVAATAVKAAPAPVASVVVNDESDDGLDAELADILGSLDNLD